MPILRPGAPAERIGECLELLSPKLTSNCNPFISSQQVSCISPIDLPIHFLISKPWYLKSDCTAARLLAPNPREPIMTSSLDAPEMAKTDRGHHEHGLRAEVEHIDALATAPGTTLESFAHLDEKKILRKV